MKNSLKKEKVFSYVKISNKNINIINFQDIKSQHNNKFIFEKKSGEIALWKAVIMQSVLDVVNNSSRAAEILAKKTAIDWLNINNSSFIKVCGYADLNPEWVLKKIQFATENPRIWRRECDLKKFLKK